MICIGKTKCTSEKGLLPSDFLFVEGRSFQHSIIVSLKGFQGSAQSYKTRF